MHTHTRTHSVNIEFIQIDSRSDMNTPFDGGEVLTILEENNAREELADLVGFEVGDFEVSVPGEC